MLTTVITRVARLGSAIKTCRFWSSRCSLQCELAQFINGGRLALSARIYPVAGDTQIVVDADGARMTLDLACYPMRGGLAPRPEPPTST